MSKSRERDRAAGRSKESVKKNSEVAKRKKSCIELCAGAGGQAIGLDQAGFLHDALVEIDDDCCRTLQLNRPDWPVVQADLKSFDGKQCRGIDLLAAGLPCPPFSSAGKLLGPADDRNLFPAALRLIREVEPRAVMIENVAGLLAPRFHAYWSAIKRELRKLGYFVSWRLMDGFHFNVPQKRRRLVIVALRRAFAKAF